MKQIPTHDSSNVYQLWLDGAKDLVACWDLQPHRENQGQWNNQRYAIENYPSFYGCRDESEARDVLTKGYPEGAAIVEKLAADIAAELPPPKSRRRVRKWRDDGDELNLERLQSGHDTCWRSMHRQLKSACGLIEVVQGWGSGCGTDTSKLQWSGAAALALTDMLEKADYSVELALIGAMHARRYAAYAGSVVRIDLKRMGELVDLEQLAAVAVYPAAWRVYGLCAFQQSPYNSGSNYDNHPHARMSQFQPNGMWDYRPNVMTLTLPEVHSYEHAKTSVLNSLKQLDSLINPQELIV